MNFLLRTEWSPLHLLHLFRFACKDNTRCKAIVLQGLVPSGSDIGSSIFDLKEVVESSRSSNSSSSRSNSSSSSSSSNRIVVVVEEVVVK